MKGRSMKYLVRKEVDVTKPVNIKVLNSFDKISVAIRYAWANTRFAKQRESEIETAQQREKSALRENTKGELSKLLYEWFSERSDIDEVTIIIQSSAYESFMSVIEDIEYGAFIFKMQQENRDLRLLDPERPYICCVTRRQINE